jgi:hypothetical protein
MDLINNQIIIDVDRHYNLADNIRIKLNKCDECDVLLVFTLPQLSSNFLFANDICFKLFKYIRLYLQDIYLINFMMCEMSNDDIKNYTIIDNNTVTINLSKFKDIIKLNNTLINLSFNFYVDFQLNDLHNIIIKNVVDYPDINLHPYDFKIQLYY